MDRRLLGNTGVAVSRVLLGCGSIGGIGSPAESRGKGLSPQEGLQQIDDAIALGINTLDTANSYAGGVSEQVVGQWIASHPDADVLVATKVGNRVRPDQPGIDLSAADPSSAGTSSARCISGRASMTWARQATPPLAAST